MVVNREPSSDCIELLLSLSFLYVPQAQVLEKETLYTSARTRPGLCGTCGQVLSHRKQWPPPPSPGYQPPITAHPSNLIHAIQTHRSIHHTQSRIARDSASGSCKRFAPLGHLAFASQAGEWSGNEGPRFGYAGGVAAWPKALVDAVPRRLSNLQILHTACSCCGHDHEPPFCVGFWLWGYSGKYLFSISKLRNRTKAEVPAS